MTFWHPHKKATILWFSFKQSSTRMLKNALNPIKMFPGFQMWVAAFLPVCTNLDLTPEHWRFDGIASLKTHVAVSRQ